MNTKVPAEDYKDIFYSSPGARLIIKPNSPEFTILDVNDAYLLATNSKRESLIGNSVFCAFPANPTDEISKNIERTRDSFKQAIESKKSHTMENYRYDIPVRDTEDFEERYWTSTNTPILDDQGAVRLLIHSPTNVTEIYKLAEREKAGIEALKSQRRQLYSIFMQAPVAIGIFRGPEYIVDLINPPLCELYGKTVEEMLGRPVFEVLTLARGKGFEELLDQVRLTGIPFKGQGLEVPLVRSGKQDIAYVDFVYEPYREDGGNIAGVIAIANEVTERVKAKLLIEEAEERARLAVDAVGLGTFDLNLVTGKMVTSVTFANIFGFKLPVSRAAYINAFHPDDVEIRNQAHEDAIKSGRLFYEVRIIWPDKIIHWARIEGKVYYNSNSEAIRILGTVLDITEQKELKEEQLKLITRIANSESLLRSVITAAPTGLWQSDELGAIKYINDTWINWTGIPFEEQLGYGWLNSLFPEDREGAGKKFATALNIKGIYEAEFRINHTDGTLHWCFADGRPQYDAQGNFTGYIAACVDITEQKHLQQQKDNFIGIASHELKTPVTSLKAYAQVLEKMLLKKGDIREAAMIGKMDGQLNRLTSLIGDLLDVTKINSGRLQFNDQKFNFNEYVQELLEDLQRTTEKHTLIEKLQPTGLVYGDKERIGQVIINLITNAIKYSPEADQIYIYTAVTNDEVSLCVQDFGIGISRENQDKVFEQFYRVSGNMQHTFPGLGLGLYISSEIIKREGGRIWVNSSENEGSTFCFSLPLKARTDT